MDNKYEVTYDDGDIEIVLEEDLESIPEGI